MKGSLSLSLVTLALAGCTPTDADFGLAGQKHNVVVLSPTSLVISQSAISFAQLGGAEVVGKNSAVCVVLAGDMPSEKRGQEEALRLLGGAKLSAVVVTSDGTNREFNSQGNSWALRGEILPTDELAACAHPSSLPLIAAGSKIQSVSISSTSPVHALGVYWTSTDAF